MSQQQINPEYVAEVRTIIGSWIKEMREEKKLSTQDLAIKLDVTISTINKIEQGKWLSLEMLIKLSVILEFYPFLIPKNSNDELAVTMRNRWNQANQNN